MAVDLNVGDNWTTKINANQGAGEIFIVKSGTHLQQTAPLRHGQKLHWEAGAVADGQGVTAYCVDGNVNKPNGLEVRSLDPANPAECRNYVPAENQAVIRGRIFQTWLGTNWLVEDLRVVGNQSTTVNECGVWLGHSSIARRLYVASWGLTGFRNPGNNSLIEDCEVTDCGYRTAGEGGIKSAENYDVTIRGGEWHHMAGGPAIWFDESDNTPEMPYNSPASPKHVVEGVDIHDIPEEGIRSEIFSSVIVRLNRIWNCGQNTGEPATKRAGVNILNSRYCEVLDNVIYNCYRGVSLDQGTRYMTAGSINPDALYQTKVTRVLRNKIYQLSGKIEAAILNQTGTRYLQNGNPGSGVWDATLPAADNQFDENEYQISSDALSRWFWDPDSNPSQSLQFAGWKALGNDVNGTFSTFSPGSPPPLPDMPGDGGNGEPPEEQPPSGRTPINVRVGLQTILPVQSRFS